MNLSANHFRQEEGNLRGDARAHIGEKLASRRRQLKQGKDIREIKKPGLELPPICSFLRHSWDEAMRSIPFLIKQAPPSQKRKQINGKRASFPSVLHILQEQALRDQMEAFDVSLLPADYDFQKAIYDMSKSRSRVFLLLDLSAIVQTHVYWRKQLPKKVRMIYATKHNRSEKLVKVLGRLGVGLQVTTKFDIEMCKAACDNPILFDDFNCLSKPNSFYRRLILDSAPMVAHSTSLAVDGPEEVFRLVDAIQHMAQRRSQFLPKLQFVLKLQHLEDDWQEIMKATKEAAEETGNELVGLCFALPDEETHLPAFLSDVTKIVSHGRDHLGMSSPELHLTNPRASIDTDLVDWLREHSNDFSTITLDASHILVQNAGALCTRIIGVRQNESGKIHYYIDDGCYGSLSSHSRDSLPLPMKSESNINSNSDQTQEELIATVWGPTCDGLDKVCNNILLPKLCRDDWLIFGNAGFCDEGTTFNGFAPPDVAYCVLEGVLYPSTAKKATST